jgi:hypothetical protein
MGLNLGAYRDMPMAEFKKLSEDAWKAISAEMLSSLTRPEPYTDSNCADREIVHLMVVQHGAGNNCKLVSTDGNPAKVTRAPLLDRRGRSICSRYHSQVEWSPGSLGFEILMMSGWWAKKLEFSKAISPQLSSLVSWTDEQRATWAEMTRRWQHTQPKQTPRPIISRSHAA